MRQLLPVFIKLKFIVEIAESSLVVNSKSVTKVAKYQEESWAKLLVYERTISTSQFQSQAA